MICKLKPTLAFDRKNNLFSLKYDNNNEIHFIYKHIYNISCINIRVFRSLSYPSLVDPLESSDVPVIEGSALCILGINLEIFGGRPLPFAPQRSSDCE